MRATPLVLAIAACGGSAARQPAPLTNAPAQATPSACARIAPILIAKNPAERSGLNPEFDAHMADAVARSCTRDAWPEPMVQCILTREQPYECLKPLTPEQEASFQERAEKAAEAWILEADRKRHAGNPKERKYFDCELAIGDPAVYPPGVAGDAPERPWLLKLRRYVLVTACDRWSEATQQCLVAPAGARRIACLQSELEPDGFEALVGQLRAVDQVAARMASARRQPAMLSCKQVAAAHYAEARWEGAKDAYGDDPESQRVKRESRERMAAACTSQRWDETLRACIVAGGDKACLSVGDVGETVWTYPPPGVKPRQDGPEAP